MSSAFLSALFLGVLDPLARLAPAVDEPAQD